MGAHNVLQEKTMERFHFLLVVSLCTFSLQSALAAQDCPCEDESLCKPLDVGPRKEIFGFMLSADNYKGYDWSQLTTVSTFSKSWSPELICFAHSHNVRVIPAGFFPVANLTSAADRSRWVDNMVERALSTWTDGLNIDTEDAIPYGSPEAAALNLLVRETREAFRTRVSPNAQVTYDVAWSPNCIDGRCYDFAGLSKEADFLIIMSYDMRSQIWDQCMASANSPIPLVKRGIDEFLRLGIPIDNLVLGLPWYGYDYPCVNQDSPDQAHCDIKEVPFRDCPCSDAAGTEINYSYIRTQLWNNATSEHNFNDLMEAPWFNYRNEKDGTIHQVWYDDPTSLGRKYKMASDLGMRGLAFWNIDALDYSAPSSDTKEMWETVKIFSQAESNEWMPPVDVPIY